MERDLISIILPVYNVEKYINRCMESLLNQTYKNIEIIMVDDGSPDNCPKICDNYAMQDTRVRVIHKENEGLGLARNSGLKIAKGKYIAFVDSDDYVTTDMCEVLYKAAEKNKADVVYGGIYYDKNNKIEKAQCVNEETIWRNKEEVKKLILDFIGCEPEKNKDTIMEVSVWKALFKKEIFDEYNIEFVSERQFISEDLIFDIDYLIKAKCVVVIPKCVYYYCVNPMSLSKSFRSDRYQKVLILYHEILRKTSLYYEKEELELRTSRFLIARARTNAKAIFKHKKVIGKEKAYNAVKDICDSKELEEILIKYPIWRLPFKYALVAWLMKEKKYRLLSILLG